jgi:endonuclease-3
VDETEALAREVYRRLMKAYGTPRWRNPLPPLDELISTILSQNTNDVNRDRAFQSLKQHFSSWEEVRDADPLQVIDAIRSAGLANQKGPRIQSILRAITEQRGELDLEFLRPLEPTEVQKWLLQFKGVGPKTAAIVMQFSLDMPAFPVDTHIYRVSGRLGLRASNINAEAAHKVLTDLFPPQTYYAAHLNLIRHGREVCHSRKPECDKCTLQDLCSYYRVVVKGASKQTDNG